MNSAHRNTIQGLIEDLPYKLHGENTIIVLLTNDHRYPMELFTL